MNPYELLYLLVMVSLSGCNGSGNTFDGRICVVNETEDLNVQIESKTLIKHISCDCNCKFDDIKYNLYLTWNDDKFGCECENPMKHLICEKNCLGS